MTKVAILAIVALCALAITVPPGAIASHCSTTTSEPTQTWGSYYLVVDGRGGVFLYEESGLRKGLQRKDFLVDDTCHNRIAPDIRIA